LAGDEGEDAQGRRAFRMKEGERAVFLKRREWRCKGEEKFERRSEV